MTKTLSLAAFAWMCAAPLAAQTPFVVPPVPPAPRMAPLPALPPLPPGAGHATVDLVHFDKEAFKVDMDHWKAELDHWKADWDAVRHEFTYQPFDFHVDAPVNLALQTPVPAPPPAPARPIVYAGGGNPDGLYDQARGFIDRDQYSRALDLFDRIIAGGGERADDSMYWKAYSQLKTARAQDAIATVADLEKRFPKSPWVESARFLAVEAKQATGQAVGAGAENNDEITLLALRGLMQSDSDTALGTIEKMLAGNKSVRVKTQALYLISQNNRSPRAREIIINVAKANSNPELKMAAVRSLGQMSGTENRQALAEIYRTTSDVDVKRSVIRSLQSANAVEELNTIARTEKDPDLRRSAIRYIGSTNRTEAVEMLRTLYMSEETVDVKREIVRSLASNRSGGKALVDIARSEKNMELKAEIVRALGNMRDPVVREYLLELLK
jgi:HEAT repeat protein